MDNKDLQKLLDSLDEGPLGTKKDWQWERSEIAKNNYLNKSEEQKRLQTKALKELDRKEVSSKVNWKKKVRNQDYQASSAKIDYKKRQIKYAETYKIAHEKCKKAIKAFRVKVEKRGGPFISKEYIGTYSSATDAAKELNLYQADIANVLRPNSKARLTKGYTFEYA